MSLAPDDGSGECEDNSDWISDFNELLTALPMSFANWSIEVIIYL